MRSTELNRPGWPLDDCPDEFVAERCAVLGILEPKAKGRSEPTRAKQVAALTRRLSNLAVVSEQLRSLSPFELVLLESLVDLGGVADHEALWDEACRRVGIERTFHECEIDRAIAVLGCPLGSASPFASDRYAALLEPACEPLSNLLSGISLPTASVDAQGEPLRLPPEADQARRALRDRLLVAARTAHVRVKSTKSGAPSRAQRRKFEGAVASDGRPVWELLEETVGLGLTRVDEGSQSLGPDRARLREAAERGWVVAAQSPVAAMVGSLTPDRPIRFEWFVRQHQRVLARRNLEHWSFEGPWDRRTDTRVLEALVDAVVGVWRGEVDGVHVVGRPSPSGQPDGHVLPNYDVMLGPNTPLPVAMVVGCAAELVRLDRIATLRLTPESVRAAVAVGLEPDEVVAALDAVAARAAPDNVRRSVAEWAGSVVMGRIVRDRVVLVPEAVATRLVEQDAQRERFETLAPGVLRVRSALTEGKLAKLLAEAGVSVSPEADDAATELHAPPRGGIAHDSDPAEQHPDPAEQDLDPAARARVQAAMAAGEFPPLVHQTETAPAAGGIEPPPGVDPARYAREVEDTTVSIERWHRKLRPKARAKVDLPELLGPQGVAGMLALVEPAERARILRRATKPDQLVRRANAAIAKGSLADLGLDAPEPRDFPSLVPREIRHRLERAAREGDPVWLLLRRGRQSLVSPYLEIEAVEPRGRDLMVLAREVDDEDARHAYPLTSVASALFDDDAGLDTFGDVLTTLARTLRP